MNFRDELVRMARETQPGMFEGTTLPTRDSVLARALLEIIERLDALKGRAS